MDGNRKYSKSLTFIEDALVASSRNAIDLVGAAEKLSVENYHAPCLSMSILALEEMGRAFLINDLLFAKSTTPKLDHFEKSLKNHNIKLQAVPMVSALWLQVAEFDLRYAAQDRFRRALKIGYENWKLAGQEVLDLAGEQNFAFLDKWKQSGFYVSLINGNKFQSPRDGVDPAISERVRRFSNLSAKNLDSAFSDGNLKRHIDKAKIIRSKFSDSDHQLFETEAEQMIGRLFDS